MARREPTIFVGTAGYSFSHWRKGVFYPRLLPQADELKYYGGRLPSVEINASFHGIPREETLRKWAAESPKGFVLSLKVPEVITHKKRLVDFEETWRFFHDRVQSCLGSKIGPILFQLPPSLKKDMDKLEKVLEAVPVGCLVAIEFRSADWFCDEVYAMMQQFRAAIVENITPDDSLPYCNKVTAGFTYTRLHKPVDGGGPMSYSYSDEKLAEYADRIAARRRQGTDQYLYFMNDLDGHGPNNACRLVELIKEESRCGEGVCLAGEWKAVRQVVKGGPGSLESMFKRQAVAKTSTTTPKQPTASPGDKRSRQVTEAAAAEPKRARPDPLEPSGAGAQQATPLATKTKSALSSPKKAEKGKGKKKAGPKNNDNTPSVLSFFTKQG
eukprot:m.41617 g.41617  ORF g.41617 m.41617 type:complete len:384 (+) comp11475_c0_seq1:265-1416(+)